MLTAHLPSGYILGRALPQTIRWVVPAAALGGILPDIDMLYFHLVDHEQTHHHRYWSHVPLTWLPIALVLLPILYPRGLLPTGLAFLAGVVLHLSLDTIAGGVMWLYPWQDRLLYLVEVPTRYGSWAISFMLHWTFFLELGVWIIAVWLFLSRQLGRQR